MDSAISRSEYSASESFFFHPPKSSAPIEIPGRHNEPESAPERTTSPELIFEMEPFSPLDPSPTNYSSGPSTSRKPKKDDRERPLLYTFPVASRLNTDRLRPTPQSTASLSLPPISHKPFSKSHRRSHTLQLESPSQSPPTIDPSHAIRAVPIHKITGFKPDFAAQAPEGRRRTKKAPREKPPAPPPGSSSRSFSSSRPWLLPGRGESSDDELLRSLEMDPSAGDFTQYLLQRIDSQKPLQFQTFQAVMSVSVR
ncbi:hypothetical protein MVEN_00419100 [Mycena venus]|uniref:Uncharacterized protein n=1 Tax=Mycena venus TaxID=2733690 RepID=A0A8H6YVA2_9AGAR|nr:hypothetical protein MVEN_00419100 [Mycena venus]